MAYIGTRLLHFIQNNVNPKHIVKCLLSIFKNIAKKSINKLKWNSKKIQVI